MAINVASEDIKRELLNLKVSDITITKLTQLCGYTTKKVPGEKSFNVTEPRFRQNNHLHLKAGEYINKKDIDTNIGIFLFNKLFIEGKLENIIPDGFYNVVLDKKGFGKLLDIISAALIKGTIQVEPHIYTFMKDYEFWCLKAVTIFSPSFTMNILKPIPSLKKEKEKLLNENKGASLQKFVEIEDSLVDKARIILKDDPAMSIFNAGAKAGFDNDYKNMSLSVGPTENPVTGKVDFIKSSYIDGITKEELPAAGNIIVTSEYPKAVGTQVGGYLTKQFYAVFQSIVLDEDGTDCGSKGYIEVLLNSNNIHLYMFQNIIEARGKLINLTPENSNLYLNKKVKLRSPMFCLTEKICNCCVGERFKTLEIKNIGLTSGKISNNLLNKAMKQRHQSKIKMNMVKPDELII